ncbi:unnamed protein product (macronuclear) [Paramecium tetraurelia]|uniref:Uncharacterized protein n=1 Tax=Paramecium tetraurelia TaxID=5888 RepID=A0E8I0_PARTE|nr:uncharacterized protein GSPATT00024326001 [Paramecium tetraurelia]CAK91597.1 unnamed protein product [Paramecium tetraurelia]|eukprot:XP_001458994.1 hypothetical protein (macronuclear) [Paramecium tetraurelia strain d4-2]
MKKFFSSIKNATTQLAKGLFSSKEETQQQENKQEMTPEESKQQCKITIQKIDDDYIKSYLDSDKELKAKILTDRQCFNMAVLDLCWKKILEIKNLYANERRINFQPKFVILEQQHWERIVIQVAELIQSYYNIQIYYDRQELIRIIKQKVLEEQCIKILFSKEEMKDYFQFFEKSDIYLNQLKQQFPQIAYEYTESQIKEISKQYIVDQAFELYKFDDCDEFKGVKLFHDDEEVLRWFQRKQAISN